MTDSLGKKSYWFLKMKNLAAVFSFMSLNTKSLKFDYLHNVFTYDDPLSVRGTTIANRGNIYGNCYLLSIARRSVNIIGWGFRNIQNNQGRGRDNQPKPKAEANNP